MFWHKPRGFPDPPARLLIAGVPNVRGLLGEAHELTAAERAARAAEDAAYEAARCPACGCHPDEHGAY